MCVCEVCVCVCVFVCVCVCVCMCVCFCVCSGIHYELPIKGLGNLVLSFSLSSSGCSDHLAPPHQLTQL